MAKRRIIYILMVAFLAGCSGVSNSGPADKLTLDEARAACPTLPDEAFCLLHSACQVLGQLRRFPGLPDPKPDVIAGLALGCLEPDEAFWDSYDPCYECLSSIVETAFDFPLETGCVPPEVLASCPTEGEAGESTAVIWDWTVLLRFGGDSPPTKEEALEHAADYCAETSSSAGITFEECFDCYRAAIDHAYDLSLDALEPNPL